MQPEYLYRVTRKNFTKTRMNDILHPQILAAVCLLIGLLLWVFTPTFERIGGEQSAVSALIGGYIAFLAAMVLDSLHSGTVYVVYFATSLLAWGILSYVTFQTMPEEVKEEEPVKQKHCVPKLIYGSNKLQKDHKTTIRTRLTVAFNVVPSDCDLDVSAWASGRAYYGLYFVRRTIHLKPNVEVVCIKSQSGGCRALAQITRQSQRLLSPLLVQVDHSITPSSDEITIRTTITASVSASGGSLGASFGVGGSVGLTAAGLTFQEPMGTFHWRCSSEEC